MAGKFIARGEACDFNASMKNNFSKMCPQLAMSSALNRTQPMQTAWNVSNIENHLPALLLNAVDSALTDFFKVWNSL